MALLILFGFIAGAATAVSPCVLPVLPVALAAGATGGRRRPLGIVAGLTVSFTFATVALVYVIDALGLPDDLIRNLAILVLLVFGITLLVPAFSTRFEGYISQFTSRFQPKSGSGDGFWSGTVVGASLGLVYAPCAGPILAAVITVSASQPFTAGRLAVAFSYGIGSALVLYLLMLGGRRLTKPLSKKIPQLQAGMGALMIVFAFLMLGQYDIKFQNRIANDLPAFLVNPSESIETGSAAQNALADIKGVKTTAAADRIQAGAQSANESGGRSQFVAKKADLPVIGPAPEFYGTQAWFNTPDNAPLTMASLRGKVVLIDFWTYSCINCIRTQPYLKALYEKYHDKGLEIIGVHTPEFPFEKKASNVEAAVKAAGIPYPVVQDNDYTVWNSYANQYWPAEYFVDADGNVRYAHFGEGDYDHKEDVVRSLLAEAGNDPGSTKDNADKNVTTVSDGVSTPESYLGSARAQNFANGMILDGPHDFGPLKSPSDDQLSYGGKWLISPDIATSAGGDLGINFGARRVYLVLGSPGGPRSIKVMLDGQPIPPDDAGDDVKGGVVNVEGQRLYSLVDMPESGRHQLTLSPQSGVQAYAFTFG